ncbi:glutathione S-transferase [Choiromyces venosus 120613-1]|uniref:glutathione transferase n=1 Tax=Choiromyces venosus 120613-1 TaxID=1336337 RepID=A0A3N4IWH1_9PEZI|nr:glutathione S-transferase [Choiromyces venosus 120613-1]
MSAPSLTLYSSKGGPNPWKVDMLLRHLGIPFNTVWVQANGEQKRAPFTNINPNGRLPALVDHSNNDFAIWESGAIMQYIVQKYDKEHKLLFDNFEDNMRVEQWLMFQMSGQGPYYGQAAWFTRSHPEKVPSAVERYVKEIKRVLGVLDTWLADKEYLVGGRLSLADFAFVPWHEALPFLENEELNGWKKEFPNAGAWHDRLLALPSVQESYEAKKKANTPQQ